MYGIQTVYQDSSGTVQTVWAVFGRTVVLGVDPFGAVTAALGGPVFFEVSGIGLADADAQIEQAAQNIVASAQALGVDVDVYPVTPSGASEYWQGQAAASGKWLVMSNGGVLDPHDPHLAANGQWASGWGWNSDGSFTAAGGDIGVPLGLVDPQQHGIAGAIQEVAANPLAAIEAFIVLLAALPLLPLFILAAAEAAAVTLGVAEVAAVATGHGNLITKTSARAVGDVTDPSRAAGDLISVGDAIYSAERTVLDATGIPQSLGVQLPGVSQPPPVVPRPANAKPPAGRNLTGGGAAPAAASGSGLLLVGAAGLAALLAL